MFTWIMSNIFLVLVLNLVYMMMSANTMPSEEKNSAFECGFDPLVKTRSPFSMKFFLLIVIFLIFDVEVTLLMPLLESISTGSNPWVISGGLFFMAILLGGLFHEWKMGALDWGE